jgi:hypothetical protein
MAISVPRLPPISTRQSTPHPPHNSTAQPYIVLPTNDWHAPKTEIAFEWTRSRDGYAIVPRDASKSDLERWAEWDALEDEDETNPLLKRPSLPEVWTHQVQARSLDLIPSRPLAISGLYQKFANLDFEPNCYEGFANQFGLLIEGHRMAEGRRIVTRVGFLIGDTDSISDFCVGQWAGRVNASLFAVGNRCGYPAKGVAGRG